MTMLIRKVMIGTASVFALAMAGTALQSIVDTGNVASARNMPALSDTSGDKMPDAGLLNRDDVRWAQVELRTDGLYKGSLDGVLGPRTRRAIGQFQRSNGLAETASLDARTWQALTGHVEIGQGSGTAPDSGAGRAVPSSNAGR